MAVTKLHGPVGMEVPRMRIQPTRLTIPNEAACLVARAG